MHTHDMNLAPSLIRRQRGPERGQQSAVPLLLDIHQINQVSSRHNYDNEILVLVLLSLLWLLLFLTYKH